MRRFWNWIVDQKTTTVRKWQSIVLDRYHHNGEGHLKPIGGSDDELERKQRQNSKSNLEVGDGQTTSVSLQNFDNIEEYKPVDFEEFFEESSGAIESALERKHTLSPKYDRRKVSPAEEISSSPSLDSRSGSFRRNDRSKRPTIRVTNADSENMEVEDELYDVFDELPTYFISHRRHTTAVPQISVSFPDEPCTSVIMIGDESSNSLRSSSSFPVRLSLTDNSALDGAENQITKYHQAASMTEISGTNEDEKNKLDKSDAKKKISPLQLRRLSNIQVAQSLSGRRSSTTLLPLTAAQIHLIRSIWRQVYVTKGPTVIGSTLLHRIFFKSVKTKEYFARCPFPNRFPNRDSFNKAHAKATGEVMDKIVENLENLEAMSECLFAIGALHAKLGGQEISRKMWNLMAETFIDCTLEWGDKKGRTETSRKAWALIIAFVIEKIKEGHSHQRRQLTQLRRPSCIASPQFSTSFESSAPSVRFQLPIQEAGP